MTLKVAINGFGRIGRSILRALHESGRKDIEIVAINDLAPFETNLHLLKYDSVHGPFMAVEEWQENESSLTLNGTHIDFFSERDPKNLPWKKLGIDVVLECTGIFRDKEKASAHIDAGAKKVVISAPGGSDVDATVVYGVNHETLKATDTVISNASCTTNCLAPLAKVLHEAIGIEQGIMTTIHSYTSDQRIVDVAHSDPRRARAAALNMIPTSTGAAKAVGLVLPELNGKLDGFSMRVPTPNVSVVDLTFVPSKATTIEEINKAVWEAVEKQDDALADPESYDGQVLVYTDEPLVSSDFNHSPYSSIFDSTQTRVLEGGKLVKVLSWYDNEWGFSNRMLDTTSYFGQL